MRNAFLVLTVLLFLPAGPALGLDEKGTKGDGRPRPLNSADEARIRERERMKAEYLKMREERLEALRAATQPVAGNSHSSIPGWRSKDGESLGGSRDSSPATTPIPIADDPVDAGKILLLTVGAGLSLLLVLRVARSRKLRRRTGRGGRNRDPMADGPMTLRLKPRESRPLKVRTYPDFLSTTNDASSPNAPAPDPSS